MGYWVGLLGGLGHPLLFPFAFFSFFFFSFLFSPPAAIFI